MTYANCKHKRGNLNKTRQSLKFKKKRERVKERKKKTVQPNKNRQESSERMAMEARKKGKKGEKGEENERKGKKDKLELNQEDPKVKCLPAKTCGYEAYVH